MKFLTKVSSPGFLKIYFFLKLRHNMELTLQNQLNLQRSAGYHGLSSADIERHKQQLNVEGYTVFPLPPSVFEGWNLNAFLQGQHEFTDEFHAQPEGAKKKYVLGTFGALGNPSSFHNELVRKLRINIWRTVAGYLDKMYPDAYLQCIPDRFYIRKAKETFGDPKKPSWHKDVSIPYTDSRIVPPNSDPVVFGGWTNLDSETDQWFSCLPGSQTGSQTKKGFAKLTKEEAQAIESGGRRGVIRVIIPAHHCLLFNELLTHEVVYRKLPYDSVRLFTKYLISNVPINILGTQLEHLIEDQGVLPLHIDLDKNGKEIVEIPAMYAPLHNTNNPHLIEQFAQQVRPEFREEYQRNAFGAPEPNKRVYVKKHLPSLRATNRMHRPYTEAEKSYFKPVQLYPKRKILLHKVVNRPRGGYKKNR